MSRHYLQYTPDEFEELPIDEQERLLFEAEEDMREEQEGISRAGWAEIWAEEHGARSLIQHGRITEKTEKQIRDCEWHANHERCKEGINRAA